MLLLQSKLATGLWDQRRKGGLAARSACVIDGRRTGYESQGDNEMSAEKMRAKRTKGATDAQRDCGFSSYKINSCRVVHEVEWRYGEKALDLVVFCD